MTEGSASWHAEIIELHDFFERYFAGTHEPETIARLDKALATDFTIVSPSGTESTREQTIASISAAHGSTTALEMSIESVRLVSDDGATIVARYVEVHHGADPTRRLSTVVFDRAADGPNGVRWRTVHETWLPAAD